MRCRFAVGPRASTSTGRLFVALAAAARCGGPTSPSKPTPSGQAAEAVAAGGEHAAVDVHASPSAEAVARALVEPATRLEISRQLRPSSSDYVAVFGPRYGPALERRLERAWATDKVQPGPWSADQSELRVQPATTEDFVRKGAASTAFPRGYGRIVEFMQPGVTFHAFRYVRPGEDAGASYDALVRVGEHWRFFPKPWVAAEAGSELFRANPAEKLCMYLIRAKVEGAGDYEGCVQTMSRRVEDYGAKGFEAYSACVSKLGAGDRLDACAPQAEAPSP